MSGSLRRRCRAWRPAASKACSRCLFTSETTGAKIYYTLDGTEPTQSDSLFIDPITIDETGMIRARAYQDGYIDSEVGTYTYFINETHDLPLLSIVTDPDNLWNEQTGIYAMGPNAADEYPYLGANFHEKLGEARVIRSIRRNRRGSICAKRGDPHTGRASAAAETKNRSRYSRAPNMAPA